MKRKINVGIAGAAGYTGGELIRLLTFHPGTTIAFAHSKSNAGKKISDVHTDLLGDCDLHFSDMDFGGIDVLFLCMGHGESAKFLDAHSLPAQVKIIDLSQDFRLNKPGWVYGLPEVYREEIRLGTFHIANPGCFATCIQLALLPLAQSGMLTNDVHVSAITGSTGAGQSLSATSHFSWRNNNISNYKAFEHQHLAEIGQRIQSLQPGFSANIHFIPYRGNFTRGILATIYTPCSWTIEEAAEHYEAYYRSHPFVHISSKPVDVKQVVNTNKCFLLLEKHGDQLMITSVLDNLLKGASGQAVQNMNLLSGFPEQTGLRLKASAF